MKLSDGGFLHGEQYRLVGPAVVRVTGQLAEGVVGDHDVGADSPDLLDHGGDHLVERRVPEPCPAAARGLRASP